MSKTAFDKLAKYTRSICNTCPSHDGFPEQEKPRHAKYRCCDRMFCDAVAADLPDGVHYQYDAVAAIPFLGPTGCRVSPEHRPYCTGYVCPGTLADPTNTNRARN